MNKVRLGDICNISSGGTPSRSKHEYWENGTIPWVKISDFKDKYIKATEERITPLALENSSAKLLHKGCILFSIFATIGEVSILDIDAATNQAIASLELKSDLISIEYLYCFLTSLKSQVSRMGRGVAQNNINLSILKNIEIIIPEKKIQTDITKRLETLDYMIALSNIHLRKLDELIKSRFVEMFDSLTNNTAFSDLCTIITDGTHQPPKFVEEGIPFLFVSNIVTNSINYEAEKFISEDTYNELYKRTPIEIGDIIMSTVGSYGHPAVVTSNKKFLFQRHIAYLKPKKEIINPLFLHSAILSEKVQEQIERRVKGIAQKTLNLSEIKQLRIPLPELKKQNQFADFVTQVEKQKATVQQSIDKLETLKKSLMQEYFG